MAATVVLHTHRLELRPLSADDLDDLAQMNADPEVARFLGGVQTREQSMAMIERITACWQAWGYSWWALRERAGNRFVGAACLQHLYRSASEPHEIGWRLVRDAWGKGLATEGARAIARHAFDVVGAPRLFAIAVPENTPSIRVMKRLGMRYQGQAEHYGYNCAVFAAWPGEFRATLVDGAPA